MAESLSRDPKPIPDPNVEGIAPIGPTLDRFLFHLGAPGAETLSQLGRMWPEIVGPGLSSHTHPADMVNGTLRVVCSDGAWASQIRWQEQQILKRFREVFPDTEVAAITARVRTPD